MLIWSNKTVQTKWNWSMSMFNLNVRILRFQDAVLLCLINVYWAIKVKTETKKTESDPINLFSFEVNSRNEIL